VALALLVGPANAGKVARLLDRYLEALDRDPFLIVPNRPDVDRVERDLLARNPALLGGSIGTFDDVFRRIREHLADLYRAYRAELDRLDLWDRELARGHTAKLVASNFEAWGPSPVFAYGFEDLTGAQWHLLEALAGRVEVVVSLPYEPLRPAFASLHRTADDLARLAGEEIESLSPQDRYESPALAHPSNSRARRF
jgi:hypothetical protein